MANKVWIAMLGFCTVVFAAFSMTVIVGALIDHLPIWRVLIGALYFGGFTWRCLDATQSRIKYGPRGRPLAALESFHVDF